MIPVYHVHDHNNITFSPYTLNIREILTEDTHNGWPISISHLQSAVQLGLRGQAAECWVADVHPWWNRTTIPSLGALPSPDTTLPEFPRRGVFSSLPVIREELDYLLVITH